MFTKKKQEFAEVPIEIDPKAIKKTSKLGSGCYKTVWKGECYSKEVAIGVPLKQHFTEEQRKSLMNEIRIMKQNPHPNIILFMGASTGSEFMIVTELLHGDLEHLLRKEGGKMTLYERLLLAKDSALGMTWLHNSNPAIIHRDLKTANLLYYKIGDFYTVKVCDFGLSDIKPRRQVTLRDPGKEGAKGTPLYMAPEVMQGKEFDEKADVYAYGMCLWEIYTCKDLFPDHEDYDEFMDAICNKHERPPMPDHTLPSLKKLIEECWIGLPASRPSFAEVNDKLDEVLVDAAIIDEVGREFWKKNFLKNRFVTWDDFVRAFYKFLGVPLPTDDSKKKTAVNVGPEVKRMRIFREVVAQSEGSSKGERSVVEIQHFGRVLNWFGPLAKPASKSPSILNTIEEICIESWFHGDIDVMEAGRKLEGASTGSFLVRFSTSSPGAFTISRVTPEGQTLHVKIERTSSGGFFFLKEFKTLGELIKFVSAEDKLFLKSPAPGSRYLAVFQDKDVPAMYAQTVSKPGK